MVTLIKGQNVGEKSPLCGIPSVATSPCWLQNGVTPNLQGTRGLAFSLSFLFRRIQEND